MGYIPSITSRLQAEVWSRREIVESSAARVVTTASWTDSEILGGAAVWLPNPTHEAAQLASKKVAPGSGEPIFGMLANFDYPPNRDAYRRLIEEWIPHLGLNSNRVIVAGFGSNDLPVNECIDMWGPLESTDEFYRRVDVALAPIALGGGMKVKVVEAMAHGLPVITTEQARAGLPPAIRAECIDWREFALANRCVVKDPRDNADVAIELRTFSREWFDAKVLELWSERIAPL
ncbi:glycosyltransferase [Rhodococcus sp. JVH1]